MLPALAERRAHPRILLDSPALLQFEDAARLQVVAADLSSTGLGLIGMGAVAAELARCIGSDDPASCRCLVSLQLPAGYARSYLDTVARLTRIDLGADGGASVVGVRFVSLAPADCAFLEQVVSESIADARAAVMQLLSGSDSTTSRPEYAITRAWG
jgi:hypothetical protein